MALALHLKTFWEWYLFITSRPSKGNRSKMDSILSKENKTTNPLTDYVDYIETYGISRQCWDHKMLIIQMRIQHGTCTFKWMSVSFIWFVQKCHPNPNRLSYWFNWQLARGVVWACRVNCGEQIAPKLLQVCTALQLTNEENIKKGKGKKKYW